MTDRKQERKPDKKVRVDKLELSKETVKDLTDSQADQVEGGAGAGGQTRLIFMCTPFRFCQGG